MCETFKWREADKILSNIQSVHYRRVKRFDDIKISGEEKMIAAVSADGEKICYYVCYEDWFSVIL